MLGKGKYDDLCTQARETAHAEGVILIVFNGAKGHGFSAQLTPPVIATLPQVLRHIADQIETDKSHIPAER